MSKYGEIFEDGVLIGTRDAYGVWTMTPVGEEIAEFVADMPDWRDREAESLAWEVNPPVDTETDSWGQGEPSDADWDWFLSVSYVDPAERVL